MSLGYRNFFLKFMSAQSRMIRIASRFLVECSCILFLALSSPLKEYVECQGQREKCYDSLLSNSIISLGGYFSPVVKCSKLVILELFKEWYWDAYWQINALDFTISLIVFYLFWIMSFFLICWAHGLALWIIRHDNL